MASTAQTSAGPSLAGRFAAAVALTIGFYVLALALALGLLFIAIWPWFNGAHPIGLSLTGLVLGISILVAIFPRRSPFQVPGLKVTEAEEPRLFELIAAEAKALDEAVPHDVYLTMDANAAVTQASRTRRVLIIGVGLMHILSERELRGVIAHEFGHYRGGDLKYGPWIYRTRSSIGRTIDYLSDDDGDDGWSQRLVRAPFIGYGKAFMRITSAISRREEFAADACAVSSAGRATYVEGLSKSHSSGVAFDHYWAGEVVPVLQAGRRPPVAEGFRRFAADESIDDATKEQLRFELEERKTDPYDSHPSLAERIAAVQTMPAGEPDDSPPAVALLSDADALERRVLDFLIGPQAEAFRPVDWDDVGVEVYVERARELTAEFAIVLTDVTVADLPGAIVGSPGMARQISGPEDHLPSVEDLVATVLADGLLLALHGAGWTVTAPPAEPVAATRGDCTLLPHVAVGRMRAGELEGTEWREQVEELGIAGLALGAPAPAHSAA